jgi:integrase
MYYSVGDKSKKVLQACRKAHETIIEVLSPEARKSITPSEMKSAVLAYVALNEDGKKEFLSRLVLSCYGVKNETQSVTLEELANAWYEQRISQGATEADKRAALMSKQVFLDFFAQAGMKYITELKPDTAHKFLAWRSKTNYSNHGGTTTSASVLRYDLQKLRQMAKIAARNEWITNPGIWDDVKVKTIAGINKKSVEPLPVDLQKSLFEELRGMKSVLHDSVLFLLLTGMRVGELEGISPKSLHGDVIHLHGDAVGTAKPISGKSSSAVRTLPICPSITKIFERGYIFKARKIRQSIQSKQFKNKFPGIHAHRLRHSFAVNKLLSKTADLQMVSYQLGHSDISMTANYYGKFVPEHFKAGFEEAIKERKEWLELLEKEYFSTFAMPLEEKV